MVSIKQESSQKPSIRAISELAFAGLLWGFGFIGTVWALAALSPSAILFYRFSIAFVAGFLVLLFSRTSKSVLLSEMKLTFIPGIFLWLTLLFQTTGLQSTTAINSSFITTLYVVIVPILRAFTSKERLHWMHWFCVALAIFGTALIVEIQKMSMLNWGDLLTLICALFAAVHILSVGQRTFRTQNDFAFNVFQSMWVAAFALLALPLSGSWNLSSLDSKAWIGILVLGFGSSLIAFYLQVRSQKKISPSIVSLLFLLESPASCYFAYLFLNEKMDGIQWLGAGLILVACALISFLTPDLSKSPGSH
jgi:drug/metabolite transporter (DMT)-like permease